jgi:hypothetical protein
VICWFTIDWTLPSPSLRPSPALQHHHQPRPPANHSTSLCSSRKPRATPDSRTRHHPFSVPSQALCPCLLNLADRAAPWVAPLTLRATALHRIWLHPSFTFPPVAALAVCAFRSRLLPVRHDVVAPIAMRNVATSSLTSCHGVARRWHGTSWRYGTGSLPRGAVTLCLQRRSAHNRTRILDSVAYEQRYL